jgi:hypothetical protein
MEGATRAFKSYVDVKNDSTRCHWGVEREVDLQRVIEKTKKEGSRQRN